MQHFHASEIFRQVVQAAPNGMIMVDRAGKIVLVNLATEKLFGYRQDELLGQSIETLVPERLRENHPGLREGYFQSPSVRAMGAGRDLYGLRKDGSEFSVEIGLNPIHAEGQMFVIASVIDNTQRRRSQELFQRVVEAAPNGMIMIDPGGRIVLANEQTVRLFGYTKEELLGQHVELLVPHRYRAEHPRMRSSFFANPHARAMGAGRDLYGMRKDGSEFPVEIGLNPIQTDAGNFVLAAVIDITERKRAEEKIRASLSEKEVLLREIHHRVKNNLAVVSSLFYLQSTYVSDSAMASLFQESQDRVRSMALVHETLYQSDNLAAINLGDYARALTDYLFRTYRSDRVTLNTHLEPVLLSVEQAIPCGLILNELIVNCQKHAFPDARNGKISLSIRGGEHCEVTVADDGVGMQPGLDTQTSRTLGLRLIRSLVKQLDGTILFSRANPGTEVRFTFPFSGGSAA